MGETEAHDQFARVNPGPLSDRAVAAIATQDGNTEQGENRGQGMALPPGVTKVRNLGENVDQGTTLQYHEVTSLVVVGWMQPNRLPQGRSPDNN